MVIGVTRSEVLIQYTLLKAKSRCLSNSGIHLQTLQVVTEKLELESSIHQITKRLL